LEASNGALVDALGVLAANPSVANHHRVAEVYRRLGVLDRSFDHFELALALDGRDAAALDGMARIWRDWGFPHLGLSAAYRALYLAPNSPEVLTTLGTLLQALGQWTAAQQMYERADSAAPGTAYILNNLCYVLHLEGERSRAEAACRAALAADPHMPEARNNLAVVLDADAQSDRTRR